MTTTAKHTAEPWTTGQREAGGMLKGCVPIREGGRCVAFVAGGAFAEEKAARIAACVNACAEMEDPAETLSTIKGLLRRMAAKQIDSAATSSERENGHEAAVLLRALGL